MQMQPSPPDSPADLAASPSQALEHAPAPAAGLRRILLTASAWALVERILRMAISLVSVPLTLGYLGNERYGLWMTALSATAFMSYLDFGLTPTLKNRMTEAHARGDRAGFAHYASGNLTFGLALLIIGLLVAVGAGLLDWPQLMRVTDPIARADATQLVVVMVITGACYISLVGVDSIFTARLMVSKPPIWATVGDLVTFGLLVLGIHFRVSLPVLAGIIAFQAAIYRLPLLAELIVREPQLFRPRWSQLPELLREVGPSSVLFMGMQISSVVLSSLPNVLVARVLSLSDVATFSIVQRVMAIPVQLIVAVLPVFWPAFTAAWTRGEKSWLRRHLARILLLTAAAIVVFDVGIALFGNQLVTWWTRGHTSAERPLLYVMGGWLFVQSLVFWLSIFLHSITDFRFELFCYVASALLLVALAKPLIVWFGLPGLALAMALSLLIGSFLPMLFRARHKLAA